MSAPWYRYMIRVRYQETDQMGVVYHANYLNWFELGRTELIRAMGLPYRRLEDKGLLLPVLEAEVKFRHPANYDDRVAVYTRIVGFSQVRLEFSYEVRRISEDAPLHTGAVAVVDEPDRSDPLLVTGTTRHAWVNREWKPSRVDKAAPELWRLLNG